MPAIPSAEKLAYGWLAGYGFGEDGTSLVRTEIALSRSSGSTSCLESGFVRYRRCEPVFR